MNLRTTDSMIQRALRPANHPSTEMRMTYRTLCIEERFSSLFEVATRNTRACISSEENQSVGHMP